MKKLISIIMFLASGICSAQIDLLKPTQAKIGTSTTGLSVLTGSATTVTKAQPSGALQYFRTNSGNTGFEFATISGTGTVTSVGLSLPAEFSVSGSPVTTTGTLTGAWANAAAYKVFGRASGTGTPSFLSLDTNFITNFSTFVRPLLSAGSGISYNSTTGVITASGGSGTVTNIATTAPITGGPITTTGTIAINNAAADGSTKGAASFAAADFDATTGNISIDYTNGQASSGSNKGFLTSTDWTTFNSKGSGTVTSIATTSPITGGTITTTGTIGISNAAADGSTKGAASFTASDFDATTGNISIDYTNGQAASGSNKGFLTSADWTTFNNKQSTVSFTAIGAVPNANGGSISSGVITLQPADGSFGGVVTTGTQTFAGKKTIDAGSTVAPQLYVTSSAASTRAGINNATNTGFGLYIGGTIKWSNAVVNVYGSSNPEYLIYNDAISAAPFCIDGNTNNVFFGNSSTQATAIIHIKAGTATANTAPLKFTSGTNLTAAEAGAMEYDGTNLFFSPSTTRQTVACYLAGSATLNFASTAAQSSSDLTITVTGAADQDPVILGVANASTLTNSDFTAFVSATNTVTVRFNNYSSGAQDPASGTFKVKVIKN